MSLMIDWPAPKPTHPLVRVAKDSSGPFDPDGSVWHLFELLADGVNDWEPRYRY